MKDYYQTLGVGRDATADEIKNAFRRLARETHPDANPDDPSAEARFREIAEAYEVLSDPQRKARYDHGEAFGGGDLFSQFGGLDDILQQFFGGGFGGRRAGPRRGPDIGASVSLTLEEAAIASSREIEFRAPGTCDRCDGLGSEPGHDPVTCPTCRGAGSVQVARDSFLGRIMTVAPCAQCGGKGQIIEHRCTNCEGDGLVSVERTVPVEVPPGVEDGTRLRLSGRGGAGSAVLLPATSTSRSTSRRTSASSGSATNSTIASKSGSVRRCSARRLRFRSSTAEPETVDIPAGTQPETVYRLNKKGMPRLRRRGRGDMLVHIGVAIPTDLTDEQSEVLRSYGELRNEQPAERKRGLFRR